MGRFFVSNVEIGSFCCFLVGILMFFEWNIESILICYLDYRYRIQLDSHSMPITRNTGIAYISYWCTGVQAESKALFALESLENE